jgi:hypothetical protein
MPIIMTNGSFNTGRDCTIVLIGPFGRVQLDNVTGFEARQVVGAIKVDRLDGIQLNADLPKGWEGSLDLDRGSNALDVLIAGIEAEWFAAGNVVNSTMFQYVEETDGSTTTFTYDSVSIRLDDSGAWRPDAAVKQRITWMANRKRIV